MGQVINFAEAKERMTLDEYDSEDIEDFFTVDALLQSGWLTLDMEGVIDLEFDEGYIVIPILYGEEDE